MSVLIKVLKSEKERIFNLKNSYFVRVCAGAEQIKKSLLTACPPCEQGKKVFPVNSPQTAHTESFVFKGIFGSFDFKREFGSSSPKLTPHTHHCMSGVSFGEERRK